jgi:hypothetical protein
MTLLGISALFSLVLCVSAYWMEYHDTDRTA